MAVIISGRGVHLPPTFKALVARKIARLDRLGEGVLDARVMCQREKFRRTVRVTLSAKRHTFSSEATAPDFLAAVDLVVEALGRQVRKAHDRRRSRAKRWMRWPLIVKPVA